MGPGRHVERSREIGSSAEHRHRGRVAGAPELSQHRAAVLAGQLDVERHDVGADVTRERRLGGRPVALAVHGMAFGAQPGPADVHAALRDRVGPIASMCIGNVALLIVNLPLIGLLAFAGVYSIVDNPFDSWMITRLGMIGWVLRRLDVPLAPVILGLVPGELFGNSLRRAPSISTGQLVDPRVVEHERDAGRAGGGDGDRAGGDGAAGIGRPGWTRERRQRRGSTRSTPSRSNPSSRVAMPWPCARVIATNRASTAGGVRPERSPSPISRPQTVAA